MPMRFVWVNTRVEPMRALCAYDHVELCPGYARELPKVREDGADIRQLEDVEATRKRWHEYLSPQPP